MANQEDKSRKCIICIMGTSKNWEVLFFEPLDFARDMLVEKIKFPLLLDSSAFGGLARRVKKEVFRGALI